MALDPDEKNSKWAAQTTEQYAAIGKFVAQFEFVNLNLRMFLILLLYKSGLHDQQLAYVIIGNRVITAQPLLEMLRSALGHVDKDNSACHEIMNHIAKRFQRLIEVRNLLLHGTWFIGWGSANQTDFSKITGFKFNPTKAGLEIKPLPKSVAEIEAHSDEAMALSALISRLMACVVFGYDVSKNFFCRDDVWYPGSEPA